MKNTVKTITLTIDELNNIVNNSASGNVEAAKNFIATKIEEKAELFTMLLSSSMVRVMVFTVFFMIK